MLGEARPRGLDILLPLLLVLAAGRADAAAWESPEFASARMRPLRIAILPAQSEMVRTRVNDAVPFIKETRELEGALRREAGAALKALGYDADLDALAPERIAADRELQALVRRLETETAAIVDVAAGRPRDIGRGRFSVGEAALPLRNATGADGFLWLQSQSVVPSKGQRTLGSVFSVLGGTYAVPSNRTQLVGFLLDARTGDLASVAVAQAGGAVLKNPAKVAAHVVGDFFRQWPAHATARRVPEKRLAASEAAAKPEVPLQGRNVEELEAIARFEDAAARLQGEEALGLPEEIEGREDFTDRGEAVAAAGAEPVVPSMPATAPGRQDVGLPPAPPPPPPAGVPAPREAWNAPAAPASRQVVFQMIPGSPGVTVRNSTAASVLVSIDLTAWVGLDPGQERAFDVGPGSHRLLFTTPEGAELARGNVLVSSSHARAELTPG